jgi:hypothetical protein
LEFAWEDSGVDVMFRHPLPRADVLLPKRDLRSRQSVSASTFAFWMSVVG